VTTLQHGTTIEVFENRGHKEHLVCCPGGGTCRYAKDADQAKTFAELYEELFNYH